MALNTCCRCALVTEKRKKKRKLENSKKCLFRNVLTFQKFKRKKVFLHIFQKLLCKQFERVCLKNLWIWKITTFLFVPSSIIKFSIIFNYTLTLCYRFPRTSLLLGISLKYSAKLGTRANLSNFSRMNIEQALITQVCCWKNI